MPTRVSDTAASTCSFSAFPWILFFSSFYSPYPPVRCADAAGATSPVSRMYYKLIVTGHTFVQPASIDIPTREYTTLWGLFLVLYLSVVLSRLYSVMIMRNIWHFCVAKHNYVKSKQILCNLKSTAYIWYWYDTCDAFRVLSSSGIHFKVHIELHAGMHQWYLLTL